MTRILPIVEGDGDLEAVPLLLRRILHEVHQRFDVEVLPAQKRGEWPKVKREFERYYLSALLEKAPILWVLDFDCEECLDPVYERTWLRDQVARIDPRGQIEVVFMIKEFESLFLWQDSCLRGAYSELGNNLALPPDPEMVRDAKGWISSALPTGRAYKPMADQARMTARLDLDQLRLVSSSFRRLEAALLRLI